MARVEHDPQIHTEELVIDDPELLKLAQTWAEKNETKKDLSRQIANLKLSEAKDAVIAKLEYDGERPQRFRIAGTDIAIKVTPAGPDADVEFTWRGKIQFRLVKDEPKTN